VISPGEKQLSHTCVNTWERGRRDGAARINVRRLRHIRSREDQHRIVLGGNIVGSAYGMSRHFVPTGPTNRRARRQRKIGREISQPWASSVSAYRATTTCHSATKSARTCVRLGANAVSSATAPGKALASATLIHHVFEDIALTKNLPRTDNLFFRQLLTVWKSRFLTRDLHLVSLQMVERAAFDWQRKHGIYGNTAAWQV